jgi:hypothetical protein
MTNPIASFEDPSLIKRRKSGPRGTLHDKVAENTANATLISGFQAAGGALRPTTETLQPTGPTTRSDLTGVRVTQDRAIIDSHDHNEVQNRSGRNY